MQKQTSALRCPSLTVSGGRGEGKAGHVCLVGNLPEPYGGIASLCATLSKGLLNRGIRVSFVDTVSHRQKDVPPGIQYTILKRNWGETLIGLARRPLLSIRCSREVVQHRACLARRSSLELASVALAVARISAKSRVDVVHVHDCRVRALGALVAARWLRCPLIVTAHPAEFTQQHREPCVRLSAFVAVSADVLVTGSAYTRETLSRYGVDRGAFVVPHGVDLEKFRPGLESDGLRTRLGLRSQDRVVLFVGDLHRRKGPDVFIRSLAHVRADHTKALIVGPDGGMRRELEELAASLGVEERVAFAGTVPTDLLPALYNLGEILAFPTTEATEGFGLVAAEALACGLPVVGSSVAAIPEVVEDGVSGILVPPRDPVRLGEALNRILLDRSLAESMGLAARRRAERLFGQNAMIDQIVNLYDRSFALSREILN